MSVSSAIALYSSKVFEPAHRYHGGDDPPRSCPGIHRGHFRLAVRVRNQADSEFYQEPRFGLENSDDTSLAGEWRIFGFTQSCPTVATTGCLVSFLSPEGLSSSVAGAAQPRSMDPTFKLAPISHVPYFCSHWSACASSILTCDFDGFELKAARARGAFRSARLAFNLKLGHAHLVHARLQVGDAASFAGEGGPGEGGPGEH